MKLSKLKAATATRHLAGASIPRQNATSFGMRNAMKKAGNTGYAGESGEVEGSPAKVRLDRARRHGGRVNRADGGPTPGEQMKAARKRKDEGFGQAGAGLLGTLGTMAGTATMAGERLPRVGKAIRALGRAAIPLTASSAGAGAQKMNDADAEMKRLGEGKATEGEEDRKHGGKVKGKR